MLRKVFSFPEFDPNGHTDWQTIVARWVFIALLFVVPLGLFLLQYLYLSARPVVYLMGGIGALYLIPLVLVRRPSVKLDNKFRVILRNPKTVNLRPLQRSASAALTYFALVSFAVLMLGRG